MVNPWVALARQVAYRRTVQPKATTSRGPITTEWRGDFPDAQKGFWTVADLLTIRYYPRATLAFPADFDRLIRLGNTVEYVTTPDEGPLTAMVQTRWKDLGDPVSRLIPNCLGGKDGDRYVPIRAVEVTLEEEALRSRPLAPDHLMLTMQWRASLGWDS